MVLEFGLERRMSLKSELSGVVDVGRQDYFVVGRD